MDMEFASERGEGPTPYEVLLHAAMTGDSKRFKRQDGIEQRWRVMAPLLENGRRCRSRKDRGVRRLQRRSSVTDVGINPGW